MFAILSAVLSEQTVLMYSADITNGLFAMIFFMSVIHPLQWPFPFVPFVNKQNEDVLASPIPIIACTCENEDLFNLWIEHHSDSSILFVNLDRNSKTGSTRFDMRRAIGQLPHYKQIKDIRNSIKDVYPSEYYLKHLYNHKLFVRRLCSLVDAFRHLLDRCLFVHLDARLAVADVVEDFAAVKAAIIGSSEFDKDQVRILTESQSFQMHLERQHNLASSLR